jgi:thiosulfate dehydrogenase
MAAGVAATLAGCGGGSGAPQAGSGAATVDTSAPIPAVTALAAALDSLPDDATGRAIRWGHAIVSHASDSLTAYTSTNLNCTSCHLDDGQRPGAAPFTGAYARYPRYIDRADEVATIEDRMNYCVTRSLAGQPIPHDAPQMKAMVAYMKFLSRGALADTAAPGRGMPTMPKLTGDSARGQAIFASTCVRCHGADGAGLVGPALWGPKSFSIGASMARESRGASFIRHNMPFDMPGTLTDQQAYDVAAYLATMPRPDFPNKAHDWPKGGAPYDVPYDTQGHTAFHHPVMLSRTAAAGGPSSP